MTSAHLIFDYGPNSFFPPDLFTPVRFRGAYAFGMLYPLTDLLFLDLSTLFSQKITSCRDFCPTRRASFFNSLCPQGPPMVFLGLDLIFSPSGRKGPSASTSLARGGLF